MNKAIIGKKIGMRQVPAQSFRRRLLKRTVTTLYR